MNRDVQSEKLWSREKLTSASYENYLKLEREKEHFESSVYEKRQKDKEFGKMVKRVKE